MSGINFSAEELLEFKTEAMELLDQAEDSLLKIDKGASYKANYDSIFRAFHSLKGGAGMLGLDELMKHMHHLEDHFQQCKNDDVLPKNRVSYFLSGIDASRSLLNNQSIQFTYQLPGAASEPAKSAATTAGTAGTGSPVEKSKSQPANAAADERLLIYMIDDEPDILEILTDIIEGAGFRTKTFTDAKEAIASIKKDKPCTVLTDMSMPEMTGFEVLQNISAIDPDLPVVFVSGYLNKEVIIDSMKYGVFGAIEKPFKDSQVIAMIMNSAKRYQIWSLLNKSINLFLYQFHEFDEYLKHKGDEMVRELINKELKNLLEARRQFREIRAQGQSGNKK